MNLLNRLEFKNHMSYYDKEKISRVEEFTLDHSRHNFYLYVDGKQTHHLMVAENKNPADINDINSKLLVLVPLPDWCAVCANNGILEDSSAHDMITPCANGRPVPKALVIQSKPYQLVEERTAVLEEMFGEINAHLKECLKKIDNNKARTR